MCPAGQHRRVVVSAHDDEGHGRGVEHDGDQLDRQDGQHRPGQADELPQPERHQRHRQEQGQADGAEQLERVGVDLVDAGEAEDVADDDPDQQAPDEGRQGDAGDLDVPGEQAADGDAGHDQEQRLDEQLRAQRPPFVGVELAGDRHLLGVRGALQLVAGDQEVRDRAGEDAARDQPEGGRGHRHLHRPLQVVDLAEQLAVGDAGAMAAGQRRRAGEQADQGVEIQGQGRGDADAVLDDEKQRDDDRENDELTPADGEHANVGAEPDGREERELERHLQRHVEGDASVEHRSRHRQQPGDDQATDHRFRNAVGAKKGDVGDEEPAEKQDKDGDDQRQRDVDVDLHAALRPAVSLRPDKRRHIKRSRNLPESYSCWPLLPNRHTVRVPALRLFNLRRVLRRASPRGSGLAVFRS